ncbi:MAG: hypothetical protein ACJ8C4_09600 [Gemmataceae bacterium]
MFTQPDLYSPMFARTSTVQPELFDERECPDSDQRCPECGDYLAITPSGYLCCPRGHGRLTVPHVEEK